MNTTPSPTIDGPKGIALALSAYVMWGFLPLYLKALAHIPPTEVVAHRVIWSLPLAGLLVLFTGTWPSLRVAITSWRLLGMAAATASVLSVNWGIYVWAIGAGRTLEAAMGYYINPLFTILLGALVLHEPFTRVQWLAVSLVGIAVAIFTIQAGHLPWVAMGLISSWTAFAYLKKELPLGPNEGFFLEVALLSVPSLVFLLWQEYQGMGSFGHTNWRDAGMLLAAGVVTTAPLVLYGNGAKLLRLSTIGILQYIAPTMIFLTAVFVFHESFDTTKLVGFLFIWGALALYTFSMIRK